MVEQGTHKPLVVSSSLTLATQFRPFRAVFDSREGLRALLRSLTWWRLGHALPACHLNWLIYIM
jgi:hypothetical protein